MHCYVYSPEVIWVPYVRSRNCHSCVSGVTYKFACFDLSQIGGVGENLAHICFLNSTSLHADLAKRLLKYYPKLMNDIYISDEYFGEYL